MTAQLINNFDTKKFLDALDIPINAAIEMPDSFNIISETLDDIISKWLKKYKSVEKINPDYQIISWVFKHGTENSLLKAKKIVDLFSKMNIQPPKLKRHESKKVCKGEDIDITPIKPMIPLGRLS